MSFLVRLAALFFCAAAAFAQVPPRAEPVLYAGLPTGLHRAWGDRWLPAALVRQDIPDFEHGLVTALRAAVRPGDAVTVIGTGNGITTAVAALAALHRLLGPEREWLK